MIIDSHCHYIPAKVAEQTTFYRQGWSDINALLSFMSAHALDRALLVYPTTDAHAKMGWDQLCMTYNQEMADVQRAHGDKFIISGIVPLQPTPEGLLYHLKTIEKCKFPGISVASSCEGRFLDDAYFRDLFVFCQRNGLFLYVHPQTANPIGFERVKDPLLMPVLEYVFDISMCFGKMMMEGIFDSFPDVKVIFSHFGGVLPFLRDRFDTVYHMLRGRNLVKELSRPPSEFLKNVYVDSSGTISKHIMQLALDVFGNDRILWGSDFPVSRSQKNIFESVAHYPHDLRFSLLGGNAANFLKKG